MPPRCAHLSTKSTRAPSSAAKSPPTALLRPHRGQPRHRSDPVRPMSGACDCLPRFQAAYQMSSRMLQHRRVVARCRRIFSDGPEFRREMLVCADAWERGRSFRIVLFDNLAVSHEDHAIGDLARKAHFMGHADHRHSVAGERYHGVENFLDHFRIQRRGRFIEKHGLWLHAERSAIATRCC